jgi:parvulin-like peptidyl-prolyl isomerase
VWRPLLHFLWIGVAMFAVDRWWWAEAAPPAPVDVSAARVAELSDRFLGRMGRLPEASELAALVQVDVDEELLYREALARRFDRDDPVIHRRLVQNMRFAGGGEERDAAELYQEALALGMDRRDPVVRRRLVQRMRLAIEATALEPEPAEDELRQAYAEDPERYTKAARVQLHQIYFKDGDRAAAARAGLPDAGPAADLAFGDPFLHSAAQPLQSHRELAQRFGADFADAVFALEPRSWSAPITSAYGTHLVWVVERRDEAIASFEEVRERVRYALLARRRERALADALARLRASTPQRVASP